MQATEILVNLIPSLGAVLGVWMKMSNDVTQLKSRIYNLENDHVETKQLLKEIHESVVQIRLMLAKKGIE